MPYRLDKLPSAKSSRTTKDASVAFIVYYGETRLIRGLMIRGISTRKFSFFVSKHLNLHVCVTEIRALFDIQILKLIKIEL